MTLDGVGKVFCENCIIDLTRAGYGKSELAQNANNIFGMKCSLSGNSWNGSSWDGMSKYTI